MKFKFEIKIKKIYLSKHILFDQKQSFKKISFQVSMNLIYIKQLFLLKRIFCWLTVFVMFVCRYQYYSEKKKKIQARQHVRARNVETKILLTIIYNPWLHSFEQHSNLQC